VTEFQYVIVTFGRSAKFFKNKPKTHLT